MEINKNIKVADLSKEYDDTFVPDQDYLNSMPDLQNSTYKPTVPIERVGIHGFHMPLKVKEKGGSVQEVQAEFTGMVSLDADKAGINMSRILRSAYQTIEDKFSIDRMCSVLDAYKKDLKSLEAHIMTKFKYRMWQQALKSIREDGTKEGGWQYYDVTFDLDLDKNGKYRKVMYLDFVYSSACPCSTALSEHAALTRGKYGIPHSQRSVARVGIEFDNMIWIEDLVEVLRHALKTETLVFCKRQDEQDFALLNGSQPKFVEDAIRIIAQELNKLKNVIDYKVVVSHLESLHSHNAISVITKGIEGSKFDAHVSVEELQSLVK